jgi:hypothetical protein
MRRGRIAQLVYYIDYGGTAKGLFPDRGKRFLS